MHVMVTRSRVAVLVGLAAWLIWIAWITAHYFVIPEHTLVLLDGSLRPVPHWREALARAVRGTGAVTIILLAAWAAGGVAWRPFSSTTRDRLEVTVFRLALGFGALSFAYFAAAGLGWFRPSIVLALTVAGALAGVWELSRISWRGLEKGDLPPTSGFEMAAFGVALTAALMALVGALAPETEYDALWYHIWLPVQWLSAGRPVDIVEEYPSLYPLTWDLLFGAGFLMGGSVGAKLVHFVCLPFAAATTWLVTRRFAPDASPALAVALVVTPPIIIWEATTAYVDLALAWYLALAVYALFRHDETRDRRWLVLAGLTMGMALAIKHLGLVALLIIGTALVIREVRLASRLAAALRVVTLFGAIAILLPSPWYARAWMASGNPFFPDLYAAFGAEPSTRWSEDTERSLQGFKARFGRPRTAWNLVTLPWDMTIHGASYGGTLGPLFLALVPAAFAVRRRRQGQILAVVIAGCAAYLAIWASPISSFQIRFLVPLLPWLAVVAAAGAGRLATGAASVSSRIALLVNAIVMGLLVMNLPPFIEWHEADRRGWDGWLTHVLRALPARVVLGAESEEQYLARLVPAYRAWQHMNATLPADAKVLTFVGGDHLYSHRARLWSEATVALPLTWWAAAGQEDAVAGEAARRGLTHVLFDKRQDVATLAIGSDAMRACCLERVYEDDRFVLYRFR
jgi:4-amino-4-deoxy-L-arabinose transferase-like glycosyltransferase